MRTAIYARVSTANGQDPTVQTRELKEYCERRGWKMVFTVLGAVAELERSLIAERVRAGLRNARAKGKKLGRPRRRVDRAKVERLRAAGQSWNKISKALGISRGTAVRAHSKA